jgi:hypothetical protein
MKTTTSNIMFWFSSLSERQRNLLTSHKISTEKDYLSYRDSLSIIERDQIDDLRYTERLKHGPFMDIKEFIAYIPARFTDVLPKAAVTGETLKNSIEAHLSLLKLSDEISGKIKSAPTTSVLVARVKGFASDLFARDAVIWRGRMGLLGKRVTLEELGQELGGLSRERVRQIESKMVKEFIIANHSVIDDIRAALIHLDNDKPIYVSDLQKEVPHLLANIESDLAVLEGILESLTPKHYIVTDYGTPVISQLSKTNFENEVKSVTRAIENIFRYSFFPLPLSEIYNTLVTQKTHPVYASFAVDRLKKVGYLINNYLLSPDNNYSNIVIGILQFSDSTIHINALSERVAKVSGQEFISPASLRGTLTLAPMVKNFGRGMMGLSKHQTVDFNLILTLAKEPMSESDILELVNRNDGVGVSRANLLLSRDVIEVRPNVWGLVTRDNPYQYMDVDRMADIFNGKSDLDQDQITDILAANKIKNHGLSYRDICKIIYSVFQPDESTKHSMV